jgi:FkbM family methyltransferase
MQIETIDLVKMDVEGAEWLVLEGTRDAMHRIDRGYRAA